MTKTPYSLACHENIAWSKQHSGRTKSVALALSLRQTGAKSNRRALADSARSTDAPCAHMRPAVSMGLGYPTPSLPRQTKEPFNGPYSGPLSAPISPKSYSLPRLLQTFCLPHFFSFLLSLTGTFSLNSTLSFFVIRFFFFSTPGLPVCLGEEKTKPRRTMKPATPPSSSDDGLSLRAIVNRGSEREEDGGGGGKTNKMKQKKEKNMKE